MQQSVTCNAALHCHDSVRCSDSWAAVASMCRAQGAQQGKALLLLELSAGCVNGGCCWHACQRRRLVAIDVALRWAPATLAPVARHASPFDMQRRDIDSERNEQAYLMMTLPSGDWAAAKG